MDSEKTSSEFKVKDTNNINDRFYVTTPIYYSNDVPHIGHTSTTIYTDVIARYYKAKGKNVLFTTGNDEHGEKVYISAKSQNTNVQKYLDDMASEWKTYWDKLNVQYDYFVRTTNEDHKKIVQDLLYKLYNRGDIYKGVYKGIYCIGCEEYKTERQLLDGKCPEHRPDQIVMKEEETYFFKLSKYAPLVKEKILKNELVIEPENKRHEILSRLEDDIRDLSTSRENIEWGIQIPWDNKHRIYVWVDALINYYSSTIILEKKEFWPANLHIVGKGINWFHSVIWPSMLLALDIPLPKKVFAHSHFNSDGAKISKSLGNVISPKELIETFGVDGTRFLLCANIPYLDDSDVTIDFLKEKYNSNLANGLGNLVSRVAKLAENLGIEIDKKDLDNIKNIKHNSLSAAISKSYEDIKLNEVVSTINHYVSDCNIELNDKAPWANTNKDQAKKDVLNLITSIISIAIYLEPITPETTQKILSIFGSGKIRSTKPLFTRI